MRIGKKIITGMYRRGNTFHWTAVTAGPDGPVYALPESGTLEIDEAAAADPKALAAQLRRQCPALAGPVACALPSERMLIRVMTLPACDAAEMDSMIQLQMDKISPFPDDHIAIAYEVLESDDTRRRVLMAGVQKESVESIGALCAGAGLDLRRLDAEPAVWWRVIRDYMAGRGFGPNRDSGGDRRIFGIIEAGQILLITVQHGQPLSFNLMHFPEELPPDEFAAELLQEIQNLNLALDIEQGPGAIAGMCFWSNSRQDGASADNQSGSAGGAALPGAGGRVGTPAWRDILAKALNCPVEFAPLADLPPLSSAIARRMLAPPFQPHSAPQGEKTVMDFIPADWRVAEAARQLKRQLMLVSAVILAAWLAGMAAFFSGYRLERIRAERLDARMQTLKEPAEEVRMLQRKLRSFELSLARNRLALEALREVSRLLPAGANITSFHFKRGRSIILRGEAETVEPIYDFKQALDGCPLFDQVEMGSVQPGKRRNVTVQTFQMNARFPEESK